MTLAPHTAPLPGSTKMSNHLNLRVLLVGRGGRESALAWKLAQSPTVSHIFVAPGNGGTASRLGEKVSNLEGLDEEDYEGLVKVAKKLRVGLVVPGPDVCVVGGIEGYFRAGTLN